MRSKIYIVTLPNGYFGSSGSSWSCLNTDKILKSLSEEGYEVSLVSISQVLNLGLSKTDIVIYTSAVDCSVRAYITDVMYFVSKKCKIIPSYESLLAHENKGFQQLYRDENEFGNLDGGYVFDVDDMNVEFPFVYKQITGAGSSGVKLISENGDIKNIKRRYFGVGLKRKLIKLARRIMLSKKSYDIYGYLHKGFNQAVYQTYIRGLDCDYKVLIFGDKYFVLKRSVRGGDFRASGSGDFSFSDPPGEVLDFAQAVFFRLDVPYASLDIAISKEGECHLIEYQILNFGPYTLTNSRGFYYKDESSWKFLEKKPDLEGAFSHALSLFIRKN